ncbi:MAG TPA: DUF2252 domain-containing protein [Ignavibacteria bacterium]|nr:DUF2252 domain-containing protein [Ignavibacteria bacterium]
MFKKKYSIGKEIRSNVPRRSHSKFTPTPDRPSVREMIEASNYDRLPDLIPIRHFRMSENPFVFYRATASIMARDLFNTPSTGILVQANGDCHLKNFGGYATPERHLVLDMNDFDESHPANFEWDLKRLATSFILAARANGFKESDAADVSRKLVSEYQEKVNEFSNMKLLDLWYLKFDIEELKRESKSARVKKQFAGVISKANKQNHDNVFYKITSDNSGTNSISEYPPLVYHPYDLEKSKDMISFFIEGYKATLQPDKKFLFDQYKFVDVALKVVGVGSVGTRCFIALFINDANEPLFIQVKEARQSVLEPFSSPSIYKHHGERVVNGQRLIQSGSDIFLGWSSSEAGRHFYFRQLKDKKISAEVEKQDKYLLNVYAGLCAGVLARAHCKTGNGSLLCGYIGKGDVFADAITKFAFTYADQTEKDYEEFMKAIKTGQLKTEGPKVKKSDK